MANEKRHRHDRSSWIICGGHAEWCYQCGAWRQLQHTALAQVSVIKGKEGRWHRPTGIGGPNPAMRGATP